MVYFEIQVNWINKLVGIFEIHFYWIIVFIGNHFKWYKMEINWITLINEITNFIDETIRQNFFVKSTLAISNT